MDITANFLVGLFTKKKRRGKGQKADFLFGILSSNFAKLGEACHKAFFLAVIKGDGVKNIAADGFRGKNGSVSEDGVRNARADGQLAEKGRCFLCRGRCGKEKFDGYGDEWATDSCDH